MKSALPLAIALVLLLGGCQRDDGQAPADPAPAPVEPAATPQAPVTAGPPQQARWDGFGDLQLGSSQAQARAAWGGELNSSTPSEPGGCTLLTPQWATDKADVAFMIEGDRFVRYDVTTEREAAPGGGRVGMDQAALAALYPALVDTPHKYVQGAKYLSVAAPGAGGTRLVFETDAQGRVITWRVGLPPQVDYVESCA